MKSLIRVEEVKFELSEVKVVSLRQNMKSDQYGFTLNMDENMYLDGGDRVKDVKDIEEIVDESAAEGLVTVVNNVKELCALAKQRGVKYFSRMGSTQLCEILNAKVVKKYKGRTIDTKFEKIVEESV